MNALLVPRFNVFMCVCVCVCLYMLGNGHSIQLQHRYQLNEKQIIYTERNINTNFPLVLYFRFVL